MNSLKKQFALEGDSLTLKVKKAPALVRGTMFFFAFFSFLAPLTASVVYVAMGNGFHFAFLLGWFIFGLIGFYMLRIALWNTCGNEVIRFQGDRITYVADYGWFKDGKKHIRHDDSVVLDMQPMGYEEDNKGGLLISGDGEGIASVVKMPMEQVDELIELLCSVSFGNRPNEA